MDRQERNKEYLDYVSEKAPKTKAPKSLFWAFVIGGLICCLGQFIADSIKNPFSCFISNRNKHLDANNINFLLLFYLRVSVFGIESVI